MDTEEEKASEKIDPDSSKKSKGFCELWLKTIWKMRSIYGGLAVHSFDVLTDILVIIQWLQLANTPNYCHENVDPKIMAWSGIAVMVTSKVISTIAIFLKEGDIRRAILQLFDLLIFEELYESHNKIVSQIKNKKSIQEKGSAIESTLSFKYIRNFEAVFESIPQSVLQLTFIMRIESVDNSNGIGFIFVISIIQSIVSMTNSILNNDYTQMQDDKWKKYKQRLPPTFEFFKHSICRTSEVAYRIGLLSIFWTVCGGLPFGIMLAVDTILIIARMILLISADEIIWSGDTLLLSINSLIVLPSEEVYVASGDWHEWFTGIRDLWEDGCSFGCCLGTVFFTTVNLVCCCGLAAFLTSFVSIITECRCDIKDHIVATSRISVSFIELIFMILYGIFGEADGTNKFLFSPDHCLYIFIATCVCFAVYSQYLILFPDFSLPLKVNVRSKWGYAYSNELTELKKIKVRTRKTPKEFKSDRYGEEPKLYEIKNAQQFWDEPYKYHGEEERPVTAAVYALARGNHDIISWLEEQGAKDHKGVSRDQARDMLELSQDD